MPNTTSEWKRFDNSNEKDRTSNGRKGIYRVAYGQVPRRQGMECNRILSPGRRCFFPELAEATLHTMRSAEWPARYASPS